MYYLSTLRLLGHRISEIRKLKNIKQEKLAELIDKSTEHISFIERGERAPSFETLIDLSQALGVSLSYLLDINSSQEEEGIDAIPAPIPLDPLPKTVEDPIKSKEGLASDLERLKAAFEKVQELQELANEYGISDIFQDNGGKVLQVLIILGLRVSPGREGNDAIDEEANEYELKTLNYTLTRQVTTHHHMTTEIIEKYRKVKAWYIAIYAGIDLWEIWEVHPAKLEELFQIWYTRIESTGKHLNNPKIHLWYVQTGGKRVYQNPNKQAVALEKEPRSRVKLRQNSIKPIQYDLDFE